MTDPHEENLVVYLLHFWQAIAGRRHYVGKTISSRLVDRMREHSAGQGSICTTPFRLERIGFDLAAVIITNDLTLERRLIDSPAVHPLLCPVCHDAKPLRSFHPIDYPHDPLRLDELGPFVL